LGENTRGGSLEDKSNKSRLSFNYEDLPRKCPLYISKNWSILKTGSHGLEGVNNQESSCPGAEDLLRKCPDHKNALVLSAGGGGSEDRIARNCNVSVTEAEGLKRIRVQKFIEDSPKDTVISTTEGSVPKVEIPQKDQQKACEQWMSDSCVEGKGCQYLHSWFHGVGFSMLAKLSGHSEVLL
jgi:pleiotropic regulator 1